MNFKKEVCAKDNSCSYMYVHGMYRYEINLRLFSVLLGASISMERTWIGSTCKVPLFCSAFLCELFLASVTALFTNGINEICTY